MSWAHVTAVPRPRHPALRGDKKADKPLNVSSERGGEFSDESHQSVAVEVRRVHSCLGEVPLELRPEDEEERVLK